MPTAAANVVASKPVTLRDVARAAGVAYPTACIAMGNGRISQATRDKVRNIAAALGYDKHAIRVHNCAAATAAKMAKMKPANPVFASRSAETAAMYKLRAAGHSNKEVAHRCGVSLVTVNRRIGEQPGEITSANKKLAGKVRIAKNQIKKNYQSQQLITAYNAKVEALNAEMAKVKQMASEIESMQKSAAKASKVTGTPLLRLLQPTKIN